MLISQMGSGFLRRLCPNVHVSGQKRSRFQGIYHPPAAAGEELPQPAYGASLHSVSSTLMYLVAMIKVSSALGKSYGERMMKEIWESKK
jgi:hypothetical protein